MVKKPSKTFWAKRSRLMSPVASHVDSKWLDVMRMALRLCGLPPNITLVLLWEKPQTQIEGYYTKYLSSTLRNCQGPQKQGNSEKPSHRKLRRHDN